MQELFMNMVMATTVGNFITFFLVILIFGVFSIGYDLEWVCWGCHAH